MIFVSLAFAVLLLFAHFVSAEISAATPLSMFRDGEIATLGNWLFGLLLAAGVVLIQLLLRIRWYLDVAALVLAAVMLREVATTPSADMYHMIVSLVLLATIYAYYAIFFRRQECGWFWFHLVVPLLILFGIGHSYGLWQKSLILYFLLAMNVQYYVAKGWLKSGKASSGPAWKPSKRDGERQQKVYSVEE